ncbi:MAG: 3-isopropylmalate dehydratase large subunit [Alphaproteobacteria bacterium]|nr:3-isopropylmalate dehydratase large subunit [Alphaproteobacteria bacterium]MCB9928422.1 3-isopropylmalate dehydratase large subunit [Alphaproteobacteria bacterium]
MPQTLFEKIWDAHVIEARPDGQTLLYVDRHLLHEGSFHGFEYLDQRHMPVRRPGQTFAVADHYIPTVSRDLADAQDAVARSLVTRLAENTARHGVTHFGIDSDAQGIVHVVGPEQGLTLPGLLIVCGDSHTATHGALGAYAFGIGASEVTHVLATQTLWQIKPRAMRITVDGARPAGVTGKDVILAIIAEISAAGATGHAVEFAGSLIRDLSMEERMTVCNMTIEAGGRAGMVAPDEKTFAYIQGRPYAPQGEDWEAALAFWRTLPSDPGAAFDTEVRLDGAAIQPMLTWGTSPEQAAAIAGAVPDPADAPSADKAEEWRDALAYIGLAPGQRFRDVAVDKVFLGSCTNSRIEDLRAAAAVVKGRRVQVKQALVSPGSFRVKRQAEAEGLDRVFREAGFEWRESGCSMCAGMNGDLAERGERVASTSNRNFRGRQGQGVRTHLVSPAAAAAAAVTGRFADPRDFA